MTTHELARRLLEVPDLPVVVCGPDDGGYDWEWKRDVKVHPLDTVVTIQGEGERAEEIAP